MNRDTRDTKDANQNQGQNQTAGIQDIQKIQSSQNSRNNQGNSVMPSNQNQNNNQNPNRNPNQNRSVQNQNQRSNPAVAPRRPSPQNLQRQPNQQRQNGQGQGAVRTARDANMTNSHDEFQSGHTRTFDKNNPGANSAKSSRTRTGDGTYHFTGRDIKSSRQRFSDVPDKDNKDNNKRKRQPFDDDGNMQVSADKEKIRKHNKTAEAEAKKGGAIMSGVLKVVLYIIGVFVISGIIAYNIIMMANDVFAFIKEPAAANVTIPENASIEQISQILYENKLIKYPKIFNFYINYRQKDKEWEFEPGIYQVSADTNYDDLIATFRKRAAARTAVRITIPEGFTVDQIIDEFVINNNIGSRDNFVKVINETDFSELLGYKFLKPLYDNRANLSPDRKYLLEGYLFPDTYDFYTDENELNIIIRFLSTFNSWFTEDCYNKCEILDRTYLEQTGRHFTIDDAIILASLVEREAKHNYDFDPISAVFHNRMLHSAAYPYLESDATILYEIGHKSDLTAEDLEEDLPYNTYKRKGLPPSAICNPGYAAIFAALWPEENSPYYFFVANINSGRVYYGRTSAEHQTNIYLAKTEEE